MKRYLCSRHVYDQILETFAQISTEKYLSLLWLFLQGIQLFSYWRVIWDEIKNLTQILSAVDIALPEDNRKVKEMTIHICGTLRFDRKDSPKDATKAKLNKATFCGIVMVLW